MSREIRKKFEQRGDEAERAMDVLRRSFENHAGERREQRERLEQRRAERARQIWEEAKKATSNDKEGA